MAIIEKRIRVRYSYSQGTGSKFVNIKYEENDFKKCYGDMKKQEAILIPLVKIQFPNEFKNYKIEGIGWA